jgi:hypothetical protein
MCWEVICVPNIKASGVPEIAMPHLVIKKQCDMEMRRLGWSGSGLEV